MSQQPVPATTPISLTWRVDFLFTLETLKARWSRALSIVALVDLGVGITQLDGDIPLQLVLETNRLHLRDGLDDGRLPVSDVTDGTDVNRSLTRNDIGGQGRQCGQIEGVWIGLFGQLWSLRLVKGRCFLHGRLARSLLLHLVLLRLVKRLLVLDIILAVRVQHRRSGLGLFV